MPGEGASGRGAGRGRLRPAARPRCRRACRAAGGWSARRRRRHARRRRSCRSAPGHAGSAARTPCPATRPPGAAGPRSPIPARHRSRSPPAPSPGTARSWPRRGGRSPCRRRRARARRTAASTRVERCPGAHGQERAGTAQLWPGRVARLEQPSRNCSSRRLACVGDAGRNGLGAKRARRACLATQRTLLTSALPAPGTAVDRRGGAVSTGPPVNRPSGAVAHARSRATARTTLSRTPLQ